MSQSWRGPARVLMVTAAGLLNFPASTVADRCSESTKVVARAPPFHNTAVPLTKPVPSTASSNATPSTIAVTGSMEASVGTSPSPANAQVLGWLKVDT
ncbi:MAG: hypothetical protein IPK16_28065 [Anaerolineales bacterium]|nr:hypothetical protein [Anaerolineales bacterium]